LGAPAWAPANPDVGSTEHVEAREWAERFFVERQEMRRAVPSGIKNNSKQLYDFQQPD
jgi:hypothetical protein